MKQIKKSYYYYFASGKVVESPKILTIYEVAAFEAMFGENIYTIFG